MKREHVKAIRDILATYDAGDGEESEVITSKSDKIPVGQDRNDLYDHSDSDNEENDDGTGGPDPLNNFDPIGSIKKEKDGITGSQSPDTGKGGKVQNDKSTRLKLLAGLLKNKMGR